MPRETETVYIRDCVCGMTLEVRPSQAGTQLPCPGCKVVLAVEALTDLRRQASIQKRLPGKRPLQVTIGSLLLLTVPFALLAWLIGQFGWQWPVLITCSVVGYFLTAVSVAYLIHSFPAWRTKAWELIESKTNDL